MNGCDVDTVQLFLLHTVVAHLCCRALCVSKHDCCLIIWSISNKVEEEDEDDEEAHGEDGDSQASATDIKDIDIPVYEGHRMTTRSDTERGNKPAFPSPADVNTRFRRLIASFMKLQRKEQSRRMQAKKVCLRMSLSSGMRSLHRLLGTTEASKV